MVEVEVVPASDAYALALDSLRGEQRIVVLGESQGLTLLLGLASRDRRSVDEILEDAASLDPIAWLAERRAVLMEGLDEEAVVGEWPPLPVPVPSEFSLHRATIGQRRLEKVAIASIAVEFTWMVPAALKAGDWNDSPTAEEHCAVWRSWSERYGAEIVGIGGDTIEGTVARPPTTREEALALAWEHCAYCPDIVEQGTECVAALAATLLDADKWFFFWI